MTFSSNREDAAPILALVANVESVKMTESRGVTQLTFGVDGAAALKAILLGLGLVVVGSFEPPAAGAAGASAQHSRSARDDDATPDPYRRFIDMCDDFNQHVDLDGAAGSGKTRLTLTAVANDLIKGRTVGVCAMSATAADTVNRSWPANLRAKLEDLHIEVPVAQTFHAYFSIPYGISQKVGTASVDALAAIWADAVRKNPQAKERWMRSRVYIDEKSMCEAELFDIWCKVRISLGVTGKVVLVGDFAQLPPVDTSERPGQQPRRGVVEDEVRARERPVRPLFTSEYFRDMFASNTCLLNQNYRARDDAAYAQLMAKLRLGKLTPEDVALIAQHNSVQKELTENHIWLVPTNAMVSERNNVKIAELKAAGSPSMNYKARVVEATVTHNGVVQNVQERFAEFPVLQGMVSKKVRDFGGTADDPHTIVVGARVMLRANLNQALGLINGACGSVVVVADGKVTVLFDNGVGEHGIPWSVYAEDRKVGASLFKVKMKLMPLVVAYAITVHKSQGMTIDKVYVKLTVKRNGSLVLTAEPGSMVYVALSRARRFADVVVDGIDMCKDHHLKPDDAVIEYYSRASVPVSADKRPRVKGVPPNDIDVMTTVVWTNHVPCPVLFWREELLAKLKRQMDMSRIEDRIERKKSQRQARLQAALRISGQSRGSAADNGSAKHVGNDGAASPATSKRSRTDSVGPDSVFLPEGAAADSGDMLC